MKRNQDNTPGDLDNRCKGCKDLNVTVMNSHAENLIDLRSYTIHRIKAQAINIVADDGTVVETRHGKESKPIFSETHEGGKD